MENKIRISVVSTFRITDCNRELIKLIDNECARQHISSRVELIRILYGKPLECKKDVKELQKWVKGKGYKTVERWLENELRRQYEDSSN